MKFVAVDWRQPRIPARLGSTVLQLTCDKKCFRITHEAAVEAGELKTSQEEADTRIILHAKYASGYKSIILVADNTDILLLCDFAMTSISISTYRGPASHGSD